MDGRFGRCLGCGEVVVFCGVCASVKARCDACAGQRRRARHREANRAYSRSPRGRASGRERQARFRAARRARVTDAISTEAVPPSMPSLPSTSAVEAPVTEEVSFHASGEFKKHQSIAVVRCACCGRVLSGRVRPSERSPARRRRRPRLPMLARPP